MHTSDDEAKGALDHLDDVMDRLVASDRLMRATADAVLDAVEACGPQTEPLALPTAA